MRNYYKDFGKQVAALEAAYRPPHYGGLIWDYLEEAEGSVLGPNERIVEDYFQDAAGKTVIIAERISADPSDPAKDYPHGSWDPRYLDALNRNPPQYDGITWRTKRKM
jgi:hypothetical protein